MLLASVSNYVTWGSAAAHVGPSAMPRPFKTDRYGPNLPLSPLQPPQTQAYFLTNSTFGLLFHSGPLPLALALGLRVSFSPMACSSLWGPSCCRTKPTTWWVKWGWISHHSQTWARGCGMGPKFLLENSALSIA